MHLQTFKHSEKFKITEKVKLIVNHVADSKYSYTASKSYRHLT